MFGSDFNFWSFIIGIFPWWVWGFAILGIFFIVGYIFFDDKVSSGFEKVMNILEQSFLAFLLPPIKTVGHYLGKPYIIFPLLALIIGNQMFKSYQSEAPQRMKVAENQLIGSAYAMATMDGCMLQIDPYPDASDILLDTRVVSKNKGDKSIFYIESFQKRSGIFSVLDKENHEFKITFKRKGNEDWKVSGADENFAKHVLSLVTKERCEELQKEKEHIVKKMEKSTPLPATEEVEILGDTSNKIEEESFLKRWGSKISFGSKE